MQRKHIKPKISEFLINAFGPFSIPLDYYEAFEILGSFIRVQDVLLFKWAEFSVNDSGQELSVNRVLNEVLKSPITERHIAESKKLYQDILQTQGQVYCVWTGKKITNYVIDHVVPFAIWKLTTSGTCYQLQRRSTLRNAIRSLLRSL